MEKKEEITVRVKIGETADDRDFRKILEVLDGITVTSVGWGEVEGYKGDLDYIYVLIRGIDQGIGEVGLLVRRGDEKVEDCTVELPEVLWSKVREIVNGIYEGYIQTLSERYDNIKVVAEDILRGE